MSASAGPLLHRKAEAPRVSATSIRALVDLIVDVEKRLAAGPWDDWDAVVLAQWRVIARRRLDEALEEAMPYGTDFEIVG